MSSTKLAAKHNPTNEKNLSTFLLSKIGLDGKKVQKNAKGDTVSLSFRALAPLCLIGEQSIQKQESPIEDGQLFNKTVDYSVFKLLLTGVDDSGIQSVENDPKEKLSRTAKLQILDELIASNKNRLQELVGEEDSEEELTAQLGRLDLSINNEQQLLRQTEKSYRAVINRRNEIRESLEKVTDRRAEIGELLGRFSLLKSHYQSDLERLEGIRESGDLLSALQVGSCPLCGAAPKSQHLDGDCDGNIDRVVVAARAESGKISKLKCELQDTVTHLEKEAQRFDETEPQLSKQLSAIQSELDELSPSMEDQRTTYTELVDKKVTVQRALGLIATIADLEQKKNEVDEAPPGTPQTRGEPSTDLSTSTLDKFSRVVESLLKSWNFPEASRVHFDTKTRDLVIAGKPRGSRGKGMRAITHAAFTVGMADYAKKYDMPHPGFIVLDTPLLAYREPEGDEDDLSGTDVQDRFYEYLEEQKGYQVIVLENVDPPESIKKLDTTYFFSKNPNAERYGLFPYVEAES